MRKCLIGLGTVLVVAAVAAVFVRSASAYGGGATHDTWQVGISFNCDNPASPLCQGPQGEPELGGFWGWVEFDRSGTQTWGDAQLTGCGHTTGGGGPGSAGAGHESVASRRGTSARRSRTTRTSACPERRTSTSTETS
jgi:hypothetical protein